MVAEFARGVEQRREWCEIARTGMQSQQVDANALERRDGPGELRPCRITLLRCQACVCSMRQRRVAGFQRGTSGCRTPLEGGNQ